MEEMRLLLSFLEVHAINDLGTGNDKKIHFSGLISSLESLDDSDFEAEKIHVQALISHSQNNYRMY